MLIFSKLKLTFCMTIKSSLRFERVNKVECDFSHWQISSFVCPWNTTWHCFYPTNPKAGAKMVDIENKVYCSSLPFSTTAPFSQTTHSYFRVPFIFASSLLSENLEQIVWKQWRILRCVKFIRCPTKYVCITYLLWIIALCVLVSKGAVCFTVNAV